MDNHDGTLSIFGTMLDARGRQRRRRRPAPRRRSTRRCWPRSAASSPTTTRRPGNGSGEGTAEDQNVELLVEDPRTRRSRACQDRLAGPGAAGRGPHLHAVGREPRALRRVRRDRHRHAAGERRSSSPRRRRQGSCLQLAGSVSCDLGDLAERAPAHDHDQGHPDGRRHDRQPGQRRLRRRPTTTRQTTPTRSRPSSSRATADIRGPGRRRRCACRSCPPTTSAPRPESHPRPAARVPVLRPAGAGVASTSPSAPPTQTARRPTPSGFAAFRRRSGNPVTPAERGRRRRSR